MGGDAVATDRGHGGIVVDPEGESEAPGALVKLIVERVYLDGDDVAAMTLRSNCHLVLGHNANGPTVDSVGPVLHMSGFDGIRARTRIPPFVFLPHHLAQDYLTKL
jgi:hypothetical protein